ncbi:MAG: UDP-glucose dehydrogenase (EC [uncultured Thiotrichaceae bacterium]|uniref:UDP-glucose dehydrogenase (EC) n=1 Tax=uncultured Thiotrichaceae bacterium TaxID=298394 RepID=A0A6S6UJK9_9GAMM|nr:MAG: UDP-glucose dehydrogenase (EC [uncultured Thiotrichaceae bacterium]
MNIEESKISIVGLGYVGLPLAIEFGKNLDTVGFDINQSRIDELKSGQDSTLEVDSAEMAVATKISYTSNLEDISDCNIHIVTVPTPIDEHNRPDLTPLEKSSASVGKILKKGDIVIYESTVYPGATEEVCIPILENVSGLKFNTDFFAGYSPERINPGDKEHRLSTIKKVTSGSNPEIAEFVDQLYKSIITAGTHKASSIKVAEAAKVIENTQRDLNIALINELSLIFNRLDIDTLEILEAAGSKWNFLPFRPGLVGGHCIGVDPYYLTHKAQAVGYHPEIILAGRRLNDGMSAYVACQLVKSIINKKIEVKGANVLVMGLTFKENCPDIRNTRIVDILKELKEFKLNVDVYDPWVDAKEAQLEYGVFPIEKPQEGHYDAIILAVAHDIFKAMGKAELSKLTKTDSLIYDLKYILPREESDLRL